MVNIKMYCIALILLVGAASLRIVQAADVVLKIQSPQWEKLGIVRPYDTIKFSGNLNKIVQSDVQRLEITSVSDASSLWKKECPLIRTSGSDVFSTPDACQVPGLVGFHSLSWGLPSAASTSLVTASFEVSCSDGVVCNGMERLVGVARGKPRCSAAPVLCSDYNDCTSETCSSGLCTFVSKPNAKKCPTCTNSQCKPSCGSGANRRTCGFDGCFGQCGSPCSGGDMCISGSCHKDSRLGTCLNPILLNGEAKEKSFSGVLERVFDIRQAIDVLVPKCLIDNEDDYGFPSTSRTTPQFPRDPEMVFRLDVPPDEQYVGLEVRTQSTASTKTTVSIIEAELNHTASDSCLQSTFRPWIVWACDSSYDSGSWSDSLTWMMRPGRTYFIAVEKENGFKIDANITVRFTLTPECTTFCPKGTNCGPSGCGDISCGECSAGQQCVAGHCQSCVPSCANVTCGGSDGCGGLCQCLESNLALSFPSSILAASLSNPVTCDHMLPRCTFGKGGILHEGCPKGMFCGSSCTCVAITGKLPDLSIMPFRAYVDDIYVESNATCAFQEGCLKGIGARTVIKFDTKVFNQGSVPFRLPSPPQSRPDLFEWAKCHGHWHTKDFLSYQLLDYRGNLVTVGQKRSFCLMDMEQVQKRPDSPCSNVYDCNKQGLSVGWTDVYDDSLDCQFIDVTDVPPGAYTVRQCVNPKHIFEEASFENNCADTRIVISPTTSPTTRAPTPPTPAPLADCNPGCLSDWVGDRFCDAVCNVPECNYDNGDCASQDCAPGCPKTYVGDGDCDVQCNVAACQFDKGDCLNTRSPTAATAYPTTQKPTTKPSKNPTVFRGL